MEYEQMKIQTKTALQFVKNMNEKGYALDLTIDSLKKNVDAILMDKNIFLDFFDDKELMKIACALSAYIGEALNNELGSHWGDFFSPDHMGANYYGMFIYCNGFEFNPSFYPYATFDKGGKYKANFPEFLDKELLSKINYPKAK